MLQSMVGITFGLVVCGGSFWVLVSERVCTSEIQTHLATEGSATD